MKNATFQNTCCSHVNVSMNHIRLVRNFFTISVGAGSLVARLGKPFWTTYENAQTIRKGCFQQHFRDLEFDF